MRKIEKILFKLLNKNPYDFFPTDKFVKLYLIPPLHIIQIYCMITCWLSDIMEFGYPEIIRFK